MRHSVLHCVSVTALQLRAQIPGRVIIPWRDGKVTALQRGNTRE